MEVSSCVNYDAYSFKSASSLTSIFGYSLWCGGSKASGSTCSDIIFFIVTLPVVWASGFLWGCKLSYILSLVKCDMFVVVIWYQNVDRCFAFNVVNAIYNAYVGILSFCWFLIGNETYCMSCDWVALDFDGYEAIMSGRYIKCWFNNSCCLQFWVYVRNLPSFCI